MRVVTFASGSSGNCTLVSDGGTHVLIDAGISTRRICDNLSVFGLTPESLSGILITHEHTDHICGLATMVKRHDIKLFAPRKVASYLRYTIAGVENSLQEINGESFTLGGMSAFAFHTSHDTQESVGYRLEGGSVFALATDTGFVPDSVLEGLTGADAALIEANHDPDMLRAGHYPYPLKKRILSRQGHLSNGDCAELAHHLAENGTKYIILGHISKENNTPACALKTVGDSLAGLNVALCAAPAAERLEIEFERRAQCLE